MQAQAVPRSDLVDEMPRKAENAKTHRWRAQEMFEHLMVTVIVSGNLCLFAYNRALQFGHFGI